MSALRDFMTYVKSLVPASANGAGVGGGSGSSGGGSAGSPSSGTMTGVSWNVYNPGAERWDVILDDESVDTSGYSAGAIRKGTSYGDYEGWQNSQHKYTYKDKDAPYLDLNFEMSALVKGEPKDDRGWHFYVAEVRVKGRKTGFGGVIGANVEGVRARWDERVKVKNPDTDVDYEARSMAVVTFTLVIRIKSGPRDGNYRTVRMNFMVDGQGVWSSARG